MQSVVRRPHIATKKRHEIFSGSPVSNEPPKGARPLAHADKFKPPRTQKPVTLAKVNFLARGDDDNEA